MAAFGDGTRGVGILQFCGAFYYGAGYDTATSGTITIPYRPRGRVSVRYTYRSRKRPKLRLPTIIHKPSVPRRAEPVPQPKAIEVSPKSTRWVTLVAWTRGHVPKDFSLRTLKMLTITRR